MNNNKKFEDEIINLKKVNEELKNLNEKYKKENEDLNNKINKEKITEEVNKSEISKLQEDNLIILEELNKKNAELQENLYKKEKEIKKLLHKIKKVEINKNYNPQTHTIILSKTFNNLKWYLLKITESKEGNNYDNYIWVPEKKIKEGEYCKIEEKEDLMKEMSIQMENSYKNEDILNKLNNEKFNLSNISPITPEIKKDTISDNKSVNAKISNLRLSNIEENKNKLTLNNNNIINNNTVNMPIEKFNNILSKLNESEKRVNLLQEKNKKLSLKLKEKEKFESEFSELDNKNNSKESSFLDDNLKKVLQNPFEVKSQKSDNLNILKDVPSNKSDDAEELLKNQLQDLKIIIKEEKEKNEKLCELFKQILNNIKVESKNKDLFLQVCNIFGFSPNTTNKLIKEKKGIFGKKK